MKELHLSKIFKSSSLFKFALLFVLVFSGCNVFNSGQKAHFLEFDKMTIQYRKSGGWINSSQLDIQPSGEATAKVIAQGNREVLQQNTHSLTEAQKEKLAQSFSHFSNFKRHYQPGEYWTDQDIHTLILSYEGDTDTVSVYDPSRASLPKNLKQLIIDIEQLHQTILNEK